MLSYWSEHVLVMHFIGCRYTRYEVRVEGVEYEAYPWIERCGGAR